MIEINWTILGFSTGAILSALMVISPSRSGNPIHSVFFLVLAFINTSILLLLQGIEFLAWILIIVYVGAIAILFLFVVMMLNLKLTEITDNSYRYVPIASILGLLFISLLAPRTLGTFQTIDRIAQQAQRAPLKGAGASSDGQGWIESSNGKMDLETLGYLLYSEYFIFFLMASLILLVAMLGAIVLTLNHEDVIKRQDLFSQISTEYSKTILLYSKTGLANFSKEVDSRQHPPLSGAPSGPKE